MVWIFIDRQFLPTVYALLYSVGTSCDVIEHLGVRNLLIAWVCIGEIRAFYHKLV